MNTYYVKRLKLIGKIKAGRLPERQPVYESVSEQNRVDDPILTGPGSDDSVTGFGGYGSAPVHDVALYVVRVGWVGFDGYDLYLFGGVVAFIDNVGIFCHENAGLYVTAHSAVSLGRLTAYSCELFLSADFEFSFTSAQNTPAAGGLSS
jgi:hypothetical protein